MSSANVEPRKTVSIESKQKDSKIKVIQYNMGTHKGDYHLRTGVTISDEEYTKLQNLTAERLVNYGADVYLLQEYKVVPDPRPLVETLLKMEYKMVHYACKKPACVILVSKRFRVGDNLSTIIGTDDVAIANVVDLQTGELLTLVSMWVPGCPITETTCPGYESGDIYCETVLERIQTLVGYPTLVMGADMNANKKNCPSRFKMFEHLNMLSTNCTTAIKHDAPEYKNRELDFIFSSTPGEVQGDKCVSVNGKRSWTEQSLLLWSDNASDHAPVVAHIDTRRGIGDCCIL